MLRTKKILRDSVREYRGISLRAPVYVTLESIMECVIPFLMAMLIDYGIDGNNGAGDMGYIWKMGLILIGCTVVTLLFGALAGKTAAEASAGYAKNLRHDLYYHVQDFSFSNIERFSTASLVTRMTTDVTNVQMAFQMRKRILFRAPVMLIFSLVMAFLINPELAAIFLCVTPFLAVGLFFIMRHAHPIFERVFKTYDRLNQVVQENLRGIRVVKSFVREEHEDEKFGKISENIYQDFSKAEKTVAFNMPLMQLCVYTVMLLIAWFGARMIVASGNNANVGMTTGELMSLISYAMQILMSLMMVSMVFVMLSISKASEERIAEVLEEVPDIQNPENPVKEVKDGSIRFENVDFSYSGDPERLCLRGANLDIQPGEVVGILGGTGNFRYVSHIRGKFDYQRLFIGFSDCTNHLVCSFGCFPELHTAQFHVRTGNVQFNGWYFVERTDDFGDTDVFFNGKPGHIHDDVCSDIFNFRINMPDKIIHTFVLQSYGIQHSHRGFRHTGIGIAPTGMQCRSFHDNSTQLAYVHEILQLQTIPTSPRCGHNRVLQFQTAYLYA